MNRGRTTWIPPWTVLPERFTAPPADPVDERRRDYILILVRALERHLSETGTLDERMADKIERLMHDFWPNEVPAPLGVKGLGDGAERRVEAFIEKRRPAEVKVPGAKNAKELLPSVLLNARNDAGITASILGVPNAAGVSGVDHQTFPPQTPTGGKD